MICDDVIFLVAENPAAHGIFDAPTEPQTQVFCQVKSVRQSEFWRAQENGLTPRFVFTISEHEDYHDEKIVIFHGVRYRVLRSYVTAHAVELTVGEVTTDAQT